MQEHIDGVVSGRLEAPELVLQPKGRVDDWPVVPFPQLTGRQPDVPDSRPLLDQRCIHEDPVVPDEFGVESRVIADPDQQA